MKSAFRDEPVVAVPFTDATVQIIARGLLDGDGQLVRRAALAYLPLVAIGNGSARVLLPKIIPFVAREESAIWGAFTANLVDNECKSSPACPLTPYTNSQLLPSPCPQHSTGSPQRRSRPPLAPRVSGRTRSSTTTTTTTTTAAETTAARAMPACKRVGVWDPSHTSAVSTAYMLWYTHQ